MNRLFDLWERQAPPHPTWRERAVVVAIYVAGLLLLAMVPR